MTVLGARAFEKWLGLEEVKRKAGPVTGISALNESSEGVFSGLHHVRLQGEVGKLHP